jgi:hypothetical protein
MWIFGGRGRDNGALDHILGGGRKEGKLTIRGLNPEESDQGSRYQNRYQCSLLRLDHRLADGRLRQDRDEVVDIPVAIGIIAAHPRSVHVPELSLVAVEKFCLPRRRGRGELRGLLPADSKDANLAQRHFHDSLIPTCTAHQVSPFRMREGCSAPRITFPIPICVLKSPRPTDESNLVAGEQVRKGGILLRLLCAPEVIVALSHIVEIASILDSDPVSLLGIGRIVTALQNLAFNTHGELAC